MADDITLPSRGLWLLRDRDPAKSSRGTEAWSMPVAAQNKITRSCALSSVVGFAMAYSRRQLFANAAITGRVGS
jgi:hypothetical protein